MEQKIKFIIIGLLVLLAVSIFINFQILSSKQTLQREKDELVRQTATLEESYNKIKNDYQALDRTVASLNEEMMSVKKAKDELQEKYDITEKSRVELVEKLKAAEKMPKVAVVKPEAETTMPPPADTYWAGILKDKATLELQLDNIRGELKTIQEKNDQLQREKTSLDLEARNLKLEKQDLKRQLEFAQKQVTYNQKALDSVSLELVGEKNDKLQISDTMKAIKNENVILRQQLKALNTRKQNLQQKIDEFKAENETYLKRFNDMDILLKDKMIQIDTMKKQMSVSKSQEGAAQGGNSQKSAVELPPIVVRPEMENYSAATQPSVGRVLAINRENNFVVVDLGEDAGIKQGDTFKIYRGGDEIASVEVIQVRKSISACDIKKENSPINVGDSIK